MVLCACFLAPQSTKQRVCENAEFSRTAYRLSARIYMDLEAFKEKNTQQIISDMELDAIQKQL
jgi:hypothetical protein